MASTKLVWIFFIFIQAVTLASIPKPTALESQVAIALKYLTDSLYFCSPHLASAKKLNEALQKNPVRTLRIASNNDVLNFDLQESKWIKENSIALGRTLTYPSSLLNSERSFPRTLPYQWATSSRNLAAMLGKEEGLEKLEELEQCIESEFLKNTEVLTGGLGEMNILLVTVQNAGSQWPSYSRVVLTDGASLWDLTKDLAAIQTPTLGVHPSVEKVVGIAVARTQVSQHLLSFERSFLLPIVQWAFQTRTGMHSAFVPEQFIRIEFKRIWDAPKKHFFIENGSIQFKIASTVYTGEIPNLPESKQFQICTQKIKFFGIPF